MKRLILLTVVAFAAAQVFAGTVAPFGSIDYVEGGSAVMRSGKSLGEANIGDPVYPDDMIRTSGDGLVVIALDKSTGMRGTLTIKSGSVVYIRFTPDAAGPKSTIDLVAGQIGSKIAKLSGSPTMQVTTDSVVMGVRGTAFSVSTSVSGSVLVICTESEVACSDGGASVSVPAGKAVEKKGSERLRAIPIALSSPEAFEKKWLADEIDAFKADAARALADYEKRYTDLLARFTAAFDPLQKSETLSKWIREDAAGLAPAPNDPSTLREKKEIMAPLLETRKVLFIFERIYYRISQLETIVMGTPLERKEIRPGFTAGDFIRKVKAEAPALERKMFLFRYAEKLYSLRNAGGAGLPGMDSEGEDFFGSSSDWDF